MSHKISIQNGIAETFQANTPAWHRLGQTVSGTKKWRDAIVLAHLNWTVDKKQLIHPDTNNPIPAYGLFRNDNGLFLSTCGSKYTVIQNEAAFTFVDHLIGEIDGAHYETAGALNDGKTIWTLAKIPSEIRIAGTDDTSESYLMFADHRDGKSAVCKLTTVRVVCNNTLNVSMQEDFRRITIRHTAGCVAKMDELKKSLSAVQDKTKMLNSMFNELAVRQVKVTQIKDFIQTLFPKVSESATAQNKARDILTKYEICDNNAFPSIRGTAWNLFNAVTEHVDHSATVRTNETIDEDTARAKSALFGVGEAFKYLALQEIVKIASSAERKANAVTSVFDMSTSGVI